MPLAGLLRDGSPEARLRIRRCACICHRQRLAPDLQRKATRGRVLWTPRKGGESKGETRVAARAVRRGLEPRIPLTLNRTSDRVFIPAFPAARGLRSGQHCGRRGDSPWTLYQTRTEFDIRAYDLTRCTTLPAFGALSFFHRARRCLSFGKTKERQGGALRRESSANRQLPRKKLDK